MLRVLFRGGGRRPRLVVLGLAFLVLAAVLAVTQPDGAVAPTSPAPDQARTSAQP